MCELEEFLVSNKDNEKEKQDDNSTIRIFGIDKESFVDGPGIRTAVFVQGCPHHCRGCHNPASWDPNKGEDVLIDEIAQEIARNELVSGLTLSGGDPFASPQQCIELIEKVKELKPNIDVWAWSGWTYNEIIDDEEKKALLDKVDVLVDGEFHLDEKTLEKPWAGSRNQRVIDAKKSTKNNIVLWVDEIYIDL